jgi:uncharacterized membrane protein YbhN (UPF0104 family)
METGTTGIEERANVPRSSPARRWLLLAGRIAVSALILYALLRIVSFADVVTAFQTARIEYLALALLLLGANLGFQAFKWRYFVRRADPGSSNFETIAALLFGMTLGVLTPGQIGEFGGRALRHSSLPPATVIGLTVIDKLQMFLVMGMAAIVSYLSFVALEGWLRALLIVAAWGLCLYVFFRPNLLAPVIRSLPLRISRREWAQDFIRSLALLRGKDLLFSFVVTSGFYATVYLQMLVLLNAFSPVDWQQGFLGFAAMMFLKAFIPISIGDLGIREASSVYFYSLVGIPQATALNAALLLFVINILLPAVCGLLFMPRSSDVAQKASRAQSTAP